MNICMYHATLKKGCAQAAIDVINEQKTHCEKLVSEGRLMNVSVFLYCEQLYFYIELCSEVLYPSELFSNLESFLRCQTDAAHAYYNVLPCIFHFNEPQSISHWKRKTKPYDTYAMIAKIIPQCAARYIFYHYQFQEERPGAGDKYGRIFLHGSFAIYYGEMPEYVEKAPFHGSLSTHNTPPDEKWQTLMEQNFIPWDNTFKPVGIKTYDWKNQGYPENQVNNHWLYIKKIMSVL